MSVRALLAAAEGRVRKHLSDADGRACGVQPDGRPPPGMGQWYYAIHWAGRRGRHGDRDHDATAFVTVTITARMAYAPADRRGGRLVLDQELIDRADRLAAPGVIHGSYELLNSANALIDGFGVTETGFIEPLLYLSDGPVLEKGGEWVSSAAKDPPTVLAIEVRFGGARRVRPFEGG